MANGSCLCGTVKFSVSDKASNMTHCHCSMCRKIHGSLFATYYTSSELTITAGEEAVQAYESSPGFTRTFCKQCGSTLPEVSNQGDGEVYVPAGLMDDDPGIRPEAHIFADSKASGYTITDGLPQHNYYADNDMSRVVDVPTPPTKDGVVTGGCQCGAVNFEYEGLPKLMMYCHCSRCRKVKGAAHAANAFIPFDNLTFTSGEDQVTNYLHASAKVFGNSFCNTCGSSVPRPRPDGSVYNIPVGSLNQAPGIESKGHIFIGSKAPWFEVTEDKPQWDEMPT